MHPDMLLWLAKERMAETEAEVRRHTHAKLELPRLFSRMRVLKRQPAPCCAYEENTMDKKTLTNLLHTSRFQYMDIGSCDVRRLARALKGFSMKPMRDECCPPPADACCWEAV